MEMYLINHASSLLVKVLDSNLPLTPSSSPIYSPTIQFLEGMVFP